MREVRGPVLAPLVSDEAAALRAVATAVRRAVLTTHAVDSCIATTAAVVDFCQHLGLVATPLQVRVLVANAPFVARVSAQGWPPDSATTRQWEQEDGSWVVGVGFHPTTTPDRLNGHLVALVGDLVVDASLDQCDRPGKGIVAGGPVVALAPRAFRQGTAPLLVPLEAGLVAYKRHEDQQAYQTSADWRSPQRRAQLLARARAHYRGR